MKKRFVAYYRVSTQQQGRSGLGLEAQRAAVEAFVVGGDWERVAEFCEVETGKGADALSRRPQLLAALAACRASGATLVIAKLDRLARNVHFVTGLLEAGCDFVAADIPGANKVMIQMYSVMAEFERDQISARTRAALAAAKARGVKLGVTGKANLRQNIAARRAAATAFARRHQAVIEALRAQGLSQRAIVSELNGMNLTAPRGGTWTLQQLQRVLSRLLPTLPPGVVKQASTACF
jgi:DNA invertase Pin-like site-specific DNA recombinase